MSKQKKTKAQEKPKKLSMWQERLAESDAVWGPEVTKMDHRERLYNGDRTLKSLFTGDCTKEKATHVRNIIFENIETKVSSSIPQPKVTAIREKDEPLAEIIENFLRNELNRMPFEQLNDMAERTVPIQGGTLWLGEWDNSKRTHNTVGALNVSMVHPKQLAPQPGVYTGVNDMDWTIIKVPTTKATIRRKYGKDVSDESEAEPQVRKADTADRNEDALTQYIGFERNERGGIDRYSWVNDTELEDLEDYQARRQPACKSCGRVRPLPGQVISNNVQMLPEQNAQEQQAMEAHMAGIAMAAQMAMQMQSPDGQQMPIAEIMMLEAPQPEQKKYNGGPCPWCGCEEWEDQQMEYEQVILPVKTAAGHEIPGEHPGIDDAGTAGLVPTLVPFYKPDIYPLVLQRSVSVYGQLLGNSDVDAIEDQQNTTNRIEKKVIDRLMKAGTRVTLPTGSNFRIDQKDFEKWHVSNQATKNLIGVYEFKGNLQFELAYLAQVYEEARQILGINDSFQGRRDPTATSGKAKEFAAGQAAGRMESQRVMKQAAYATLFELMFKFQLAYADEPRPVTYKDFNGKAVYKEFNRYDFLEQDEDGNWYWNDQFLFSCDTAGPLASNREAMWQETRMNLQTGAFGDPAATETLILFWGKMELLHYPGAADTKKYLEQRLEQEKLQKMQMMAMQANQTPAAQGAPGQGAQAPVSAAM